jgi:hypothetical protein
VITSARNMVLHPSFAKPHCLLVVTELTPEPFVQQAPASAWVREKLPAADLDGLDHQQQGPEDQVTA